MRSITCFVPQEGEWKHCLSQLSEIAAAERRIRLARLDFGLFVKELFAMSRPENDSLPGLFR
jgi:hypothetical protein